MHNKPPKDLLKSSNVKVMFSIENMGHSCAELSFITNERFMSKDFSWAHTMISDLQKKLGKKLGTRTS